MDVELELLVISVEQIRLLPLAPDAPEQVQVGTLENVPAAKVSVETPVLSSAAAVTQSPLDLVTAGTPEFVM